MLWDIHVCSVLVDKNKPDIESERNGSRNSFESSFDSITARRLWSLLCCWLLLKRSSMSSIFQFTPHLCSGAKESNPRIPLNGEVREREQCVLCWRMLSDGRSNYLRLPKDKAKEFNTGNPTTTWEWQQLLIKRDVDGAFAAPADLKEEDLNLIQDWDRRWWRGPPRDEQQLLK